MHRRRPLGAANDDPGVLLAEAASEAARAVRLNSRLGLRKASELAWLGASSTADIAANKLGLEPPRGFNARYNVFDVLERKGKLRRGSLTALFDACRTILHGDCFHDNECRPSSVLGQIDGAKRLAELSNHVVEKIKRRR